jgi:hypothetical protein
MYYYETKDRSPQYVTTLTEIIQNSEESRLGFVCKVEKKIHEGMVKKETK